jgi:uncharacterized protein with FMN-binding domain
MKQILKILKWTGIILAAMILISGIYGFFGLKQARELDISRVDLSLVPDGTYTGTYKSYRWTNTVAVTVRDGQITAIEPTVPLAGREDLAAELTQDIIERQRTDVDAVTGATASSNAFLKAVENALKDTTS